MTTTVNNEFLINRAFAALEKFAKMSPALENDEDALNAAVDKVNMAVEAAQAIDIETLGEAGRVAELTLAYDRSELVERHVRLLEAIVRLARKNIN